MWTSMSTRGRSTSVRRSATKSQRDPTLTTTVDPLDSTPIGPPGSTMPITAGSDRPRSPRTITATSREEHQRSSTTPISPNSGGGSSSRSVPAAHARIKEPVAPGGVRAVARNQQRELPAHQRDASALSQAPSAQPLTGPMLLRLQRLAGNRAVAQLLQPHLPATIQRATLGWEGAEEDSWNKGEQTVTAEGTKAKPGEAGAIRMPVSGISAGRTGAMKGETGGSSDPNIGAKLREMNKADPEIRAGKKPPHTNLAVSSVTSEAAAAETGGEAIVIVPPGLPAGPVDILFHLHGHTIGYRQA